jgi:hypothetical protein
MFRTWFQLHQALPPGVHPYPTLAGKKRFELLQTFNLVLSLYLGIHHLLMPATVWLLQDQQFRQGHGFGFWYLYHVIVAACLWQRLRRPASAYLLVYLGWFALGYLPLALARSFLHHGQFHVSWTSISGLLCYGSSFLFTIFLLYRMRMPTTAYLFHLEHRIIPRWRYAIPYWLAGLALGLASLLLTIARAPEPPPPPQRPPPVYLYE